MNNLDQVHKMLEGGYTSMPQPQDTEKQVYFVCHQLHDANLVLLGRNIMCHEILSRQRHIILKLPILY